MAEFGYEAGEFGGLTPIAFAGTTITRIATVDADTLEIETVDAITGGNAITLTFTADGNPYVLTSGTRSGSVYTVSETGIRAALEAELANTLNLQIAAADVEVLPS